jgi:hypothetical protein
MPGGMRIPKAAGGKPPAPRAMLNRSDISTLAFARPMAGTIHSPQLHCIPCQANLPILAPQAVFGHVKRPDNGASSGREPYSVASESAVVLGKRDGRIHVSGWRKM